MTFRNFFGTTTFDRPVLFREIPGHDSAYLVVQQSGAMVAMRRLDGAWQKFPFDSIAVGGVNGPGVTDDGGLVGFAFHPGYAANRRYYVWYVDSYAVAARPGRIRFEERTADFTLLKASGLPPRLLLTLNKPYIYHNGGTLKFGSDGYLYTAIGDGGGAGDPENRSQNTGVLFGKFLRLDVDGPDAFADTTRNYAVPPDNPFVDSSGFLPEIWAYGLRSPWKWSFHPVTGEIWMGDIGQDRYEEITRVPRGGNQGWKIREGAFCFPAGTTTCREAGLTAPAFTFPSRTYGNSVTGGVFFRGDPSDAFQDLYIFGDFGRGRVWALREAGGNLIDTAQIGSVLNVVSIDKDARGRVFAVSMSSSANWNSITAGNGVVYLLESPDMRPAGDPVPVHDPGRMTNRRVPIKSLRLSEFLKHRDRYLALGLDGRMIEGIPSGIFLVRDKAGIGPVRLVSPVW